MSDWQDTALKYHSEIIRLTQRNAEAEAKMRKLDARLKKLTRLMREAITIADEDHIAIRSRILDVVWEAEELIKKWETEQ